MKISNDGWCSWQGAAGADGVHVRVRRTDEGRLVVTDLYVHGEQLSAETLRAISVSRIEAMLNAPVEESLRGMLLSAAQQWAADPAPDRDLTLGELRSRRNGRTPRRARREPLTRPDGTDAFYRQVAAAYAEYARDSHAPAKRIAEEAGVPVSTAHRWVREARRRGHLPPGQKGRAG